MREAVCEAGAVVGGGGGAKLARGGFGAAAVDVGRVRPLRGDGGTMPVDVDVGRVRGVGGGSIDVRRSAGGAAFDADEGGREARDVRDEGLVGEDARG